MDGESEKGRENEINYQLRKKEKQQETARVNRLGKE